MIYWSTAACASTGAGTLGVQDDGFPVASAVSIDDGKQIILKHATPPTEWDLTVVDRDASGRGSVFFHPAPTQRAEE